MPICLGDNYEKYNVTEPDAQDNKYIVTRLYTENLYFLVLIVLKHDFHLTGKRAKFQFRYYKSETPNLSNLI